MAEHKKENPHQGHRSRMRERVKQQGVGNMPEHEVLEFLLYPFIPMKDTNPIAHDLIKRFGSLSQVLDTSSEMLTEVNSMTDNAALYLSILPELFKIYNLQKIGDKPMLDTPLRTFEYFKTLFSTEKVEAFYMAIVDSKGQLMESCRVGEGEIDSCRLDTREFIMRTANSPSNCVILVHNHPSGDPTPSQSDCEFTSWLLSLTEVIGVALLDHLIITKDAYYSFRDNDRLEYYADVLKDYLDKIKASDKFSVKIRKFNDKK